MDSIKKRKALITGVCGFNGSYMAELLLGNGFEVRGTDLPTANLKNIKGLDVEFIPADLNNLDELKKVTRGIDIIFHIASLFDYLPDLEKMRRVNVDGTRNLLIATKENKVKRFIHWSTVDVYGYPIPKFTPIKEDHPKNPENAYQVSKWEQEQLVREFCQKEGIDFTIIRPAPIYGPRSIYGMVSMPILIAKGYLLFYLSGDKLHIPLVYVKDVCRAALFLVDKKESIGEVYQVCDDTWYNHKRFFLYIASLLGEEKNMVRLPVIPRPVLKFFLIKLYKYWKKKAEKAYPKRLVFDADEIAFGFNDYRFSNEKIKKLGFKFDYPDFTKGMVETINWLKENKYI